MADDPYGEERNDTCRTLESKCQDCREIHITDVITTHFTNCGKPFWCAPPYEHEGNHRICVELHHQWHRVRRSLENEWGNMYPNYNPIFATDTDWNSANGFYTNFSEGHCRGLSDYITMQFPNLTSDIPLLPTKLFK